MKPKDRLFQALLRDTGEELRASGFRARGQTFLLHRENWGLIHFQKARETPGPDVALTVNLGVASTTLRRLERKDVDKPPKEPECHLRIRVGELLPPYQEIWWRLGDDATLEDVSQKLRTELRRTAIPFVLGHLSDRALCEMWLGGRSPGLTPLQRLRNLSLLLAVIGPRSELGAVLSQLEEKSRGHAGAVQEMIREFDSERAGTDHLTTGG